MDPVKDAFLKAYEEKKAENNAKVTATNTFQWSPVTPAPCPSCGYCQHCGRGRTWPTWPTYPTYPSTPWITYTATVPRGY